MPALLRSTPQLWEPLSRLCSHSTMCRSPTHVVLPLPLHSGPTQDREALSFMCKCHVHRCMTRTGTGRGKGGFPFSLFPIRITENHRNRATEAGLSPQPQNLPRTRSPKWPLPCVTVALPPTLSAVGSDLCICPSKPQMRLPREVRSSCSQPPHHRQAIIVQELFVQTPFLCLQHLPLFPAKHAMATSELTSELQNGKKK